MVFGLVVPGLLLEVLEDVEHVVDNIEEDIDMYSDNDVVVSVYTENIRRIVALVCCNPSFAR